MSAPRSLYFGDMTVVGRADASLPPGKLIAALAVVATKMHPEFAKPIYRHKKPDQSKESCILASLTVRDFLRSVGFARATVVPVKTVIRATRDGETLHSVGLGFGDEHSPPGWRGHLVVTCAGWLIDATLYQANRPAWPHLPGMMTVPLGRGPALFGMRSISALTFTDEETNYACDVAWLDNPENVGWSKAPDAQRIRRQPVVDLMRSVIDEAREAA